MVSVEQKHVYLIELTISVRWSTDALDGKSSVSEVPSGLRFCALLTWCGMRDLSALLQLC
jgi:hypothetical protein